MKRSIESAFLAWKNRSERKPLVLLGARQVGKTWLMRDFGKRHFAHVHEFNFDGNELLANLFVNTKRPQNFWGQAPAGLLFSWCLRGFC